LPRQLHQEIVSISASPEQTRALGRSLGRRLSPGHLICLYGELGAGKTTFIQGLAEGLGVQDPVTSPSFTLIHEHSGPARLYHIDLYRLAAADLEDIGIEEVLEADAVVAVEWAERLPADLRRGALDVDIAFADGESARRLRLRAHGEAAARTLAALSEDLGAHPRP
jgi:tRNA threonylcarbamoyladenosine biosynthesis protein TsaE